MLLGYLGYTTGQPVIPLKILGALCWLLGGAVCAWTVFAFWQYGKGTPTPSEPTSLLVDKGLYRYSRNPMYLGCMVIVIGYFFYFQTWVQLIYIFIAGLFFHAVVVLGEERITRRRFGDQYDAYCQRVPRWIGLPSEGDKKGD